ncbi:chitotriosidase-1-like [Olea europaea subsp. europaea]|uniref:Chitotriosidase-1-like n=1 Tax=Olea europaea subsp. europaea TaxID=158383 RepID=A0A8S0V218_OLEEU|nr:chitotriosidase-1-like [Olea europaea subsp. europaea]
MPPLLNLQKLPNVRTLLSKPFCPLVVEMQTKTVFASMAAQSTSRKSFIDSSIKLARSYGFSGLDLDWEYPRTASDMANLGLLLNEWRTAVAVEATASSKLALVLTAAISFAPTVNGLKYPVQSINSNLDWINVMAYDFYDPSCGSYGVRAWTQAGVRAKKLVLGMPSYGYAFRLVNAKNHGLLAPANVPASPDTGAMGYRQIKNFIAQNKAVTVCNSTIVANYCYVGTTWIGFDDTQTIAAKVSYAKQKGLLGYFAWHVGVDNNWALSQQAKQSWGA